MQNNFIFYLTVLSLIFAAGKVFGHLDWSWGWVTSPVWIMAAIGLLNMFWMGMSRNRQRADLTSILGGLQNLIREKAEKDKEKRTFN